MDDILTIEDYKNIYDNILSIADEFDGVGSNNITDETKEKAKIVKDIIECLTDVPQGKIDYYKL
jgi:hypothetical protein